MHSSHPFVNPWRGEAAIILDGKQYILRPSFQALCDIEQQLNCGLFTLARQLADGQLGLLQLVTIIRSCYCGTEVPPLWEEALIRNGVNQAMTILVALFTQIFEGFSIA